jgi:hypothetical protein
MIRGSLSPAYSVSVQSKEVQVCGLHRLLRMQAVRVTDVFASLTLYQRRRGMVAYSRSLKSVDLCSIFFAAASFCSKNSNKSYGNCWEKRRYIFADFDVPLARLVCKYGAWSVDKLKTENTNLNFLYPVCSLHCAVCVCVCVCVWK